MFGLFVSGDRRVVFNRRVYVRRRVLLKNNNVSFKRKMRRGFKNFGRYQIL